MSQEAIKKAFERAERALSLRPSIGRGTAKTTVRLGEGLACEARDGRWGLTVDMSEKSGGSGTSPDPGVFGRTALGSCLAIGYARWAAVRGVPIRGLEVEVHADYDAAHEYGVGDEPPGYSEVRYVVRVESDAEEEEILRVLDEADACSPWLDVFRRSIRLQRKLWIVQSEE